jgi:hypothetical protein
MGSGKTQNMAIEVHMKALAPIWDLIVMVLNFMAFVWLASFVFIVVFFLYHWVTGKPISMDYDGPDF